MKKLVLILMLFVHVICYSQTARYVSKTGNCEYPYTSWEAACDSIKPVIDIAEMGDTIFIGSGVFVDTLDIYKDLTIIGLGPDQTIINCDKRRRHFMVVHNCVFSIKNVGLIGTDSQFILNNSVLIYNDGECDLFVDNCLLKNSEHGIVNYVGNINVNNSVFRIYNDDGILASNSVNADYSRNVITNCFFYAEKGVARIILFEGRYLEFRNNICHGNLTFGIFSITCDTMIIENNVFSTIESAVNVTQARGKVRVANNVFHNGMGSQTSPAVFVVRSPRVEFFNNVVYRYPQAIELRQEIDSYYIDYNCIYKNTRWFDDTVSVGNHNYNLNPMFAKTLEGQENSEELNLRLQKFSPCIDSGHPELFDLDGTRSDMGIYGGPFGLTYVYEDLPPAAPTDLRIIEDNDTSYQILWDANTENDLAGYTLYMGDSYDFLPSAQNRIGQVDTNYFAFSGQYSSNKYIRVSACDNQENETIAERRLQIIVTGLKENEIKTKNYQLYQNYPNPFNPQTKVMFSLKEAGLVKIKVFDMKGELVKKEKEKLYPAGGHEVSLNLTNFASGIYIVILKVEQSGKPIFIDSKKITLLK